MRTVERKIGQEGDEGGKPDKSAVVTRSRPEAALRSAVAAHAGSAALRIFGRGGFQPQFKFGGVPVVQIFDFEGVLAGVKPDARAVSVVAAFVDAVTVEEDARIRPALVYTEAVVAAFADVDFARPVGGEVFRGDVFEFAPGVIHFDGADVFAGNHALRFFAPEYSGAVKGDGTAELRAVRR